jgi:hypothetical protein
MNIRGFERPGLGLPQAAGQRERYFLHLNPNRRDVILSGDTFEWDQRNTSLSRSRRIDEVVLEGLGNRAMRT